MERNSLPRSDADILRLDLRPPHADPERGLELADIEAVRLVLRGGSPIDWHRLNYRSIHQVDDFLRANLLDPSDPRDMARLEYLHREALRYLRRNFTFRFPAEVERPEDVRHLFLYASEIGRLNRVQILSCVVLKTMHTINHLEARELLLETSVSEAQLITVMEQQVLARARAMTDHGLPVVHFYGSRKTRDSMVSKLLSKKAARASDILDKLRFRIVTEARDQVVPVLAYMLRHVFPWNHVTSGQSTNKLLDLHRWLEVRDATRPFLDGLQVDVDIEEADQGEVNEFSGSNYRMINFIVDVPVRLDHLVSRAGDPWMLQKGSIVYVACEFQIVDQETAWLNERGENSHRRYKLRQREKVGERLMWGLLKERRRGGEDRPSGPIRMARPPRARSALEILVQDDSDADAPVPRPVRAPEPARFQGLLEEMRASRQGGVRGRGPKAGEWRQRRVEDAGIDPLKVITGEIKLPDSLRRAGEEIRMAGEALVAQERANQASPLEGRIHEEDSMLEALRD